MYDQRLSGYECCKTVVVSHRNADALRSIYRAEWDQTGQLNASHGISIAPSIVQVRCSRLQAWDQSSMLIRAWDSYAFATDLVK
jgi:hypothetical protein